jgi:hypothetical protein
MRNHKKVEMVGILGDIRDALIRIAEAQERSNEAWFEYCQPKKKKGNRLRLRMGERAGSPNRGAEGDWII